MITELLNRIDKLITEVNKEISSNPENQFLLGKREGLERAMEILEFAWVKEVSEGGGEV